MSSGGAFKLTANDGKSDELMMATTYLNNRIAQIKCERQKKGLSGDDLLPTLSDIEKTHVLFMNAHFKPYAAIGTEYNKVKTQSGSSQYGGTAVYSIPQFGDFYTDMVVNVILNSTQATVGTVPAFPAPIGAVNIVTTSTSQTSGTQNTNTGVYLQYKQEYVDDAGNVLTVGAAASNFVRYCEYPGMRLFKHTYIVVNNAYLDDYLSDTYVFYQKFQVPPNKLSGWKRLVGQELPINAYTDLVSVAGASRYPGPASGLDGSPGIGAPVATSTARVLKTILNGPQTPQAVQPALEMWIPLLFWFSDARLAVPAVSLPFGQRFINIDLEAQANILFTAPGNLYLRTTVQQVTSASTNMGTATAIAVTNVNEYQTKVPVLAAGSNIDVTQQIATMDLYINNIFVLPNIHDVYINKIGFSLIRVHKFQTQTVSTANGQILLAQLKYPTETIYFGLRPTVNIQASNLNSPRDWHRLTANTDNVIDDSARGYTNVMIDDTVAWNAVGTKQKTCNTQISTGRTTFPTTQETVDSLTVIAHGVTIIAQLTSKFYSAYTPYAFGGANITTPEDRGALMVNFALYPGSYQPSGHLNLSRARETYLNYTSSYVGSNTTADILVSATAINFLLIADGSATLRYTT